MKMTDQTMSGFKGPWVRSRMNCWDWIRQNKMDAMIVSLLGLAFGAFLIMAGRSWLENPSPGNPQIIESPEVFVHADGGRTLRLHYHFVDSGECIRDGKYSLSRDIYTPEGVIKAYRPLGSFQNGLGITKGAQDYFVELSVPIDLQPGFYQLRLTINYTCPLFPSVTALLSHTMAWAAEPVMVNF